MMLRLKFGTVLPPFRRVDAPVAVVALHPGQAFLRDRDLQLGVLEECLRLTNTALTLRCEVLECLLNV
jgi:hypothetical protein